MAGPPQNLQDVEAELLGNVYSGSAKSTATNLYFDLIPADDATAAYLNGTSFSQSVWLDPSSQFSISYFNPEGDGPVCGGSYVNFLNDDLSGSAQEIHASGPGSGLPGGFETHCLIPGKYEVRLRQNQTVLKSFFVDYIPGGTGGQAAPIATAGSTTMWIEAPSFSPTGTLEWPDLVVNFHLSPSGSFTDTAFLDIENAGSNINKSTFSNQATPTGTLTDWFRFRTDRSTSTWNLGSRGKMLMGIWWRGNNPQQRSGFFDHAEQPVLRVYQYDGEVTPPSTVVAGLEVKRPDENPASQPAVTRNISIIVDTQPDACFSVEGSTTWRNVDQFFNAGCSDGSNLQYSWDTGSGYGAYTNDPVLEFFGHASSGGKQVRLRVRDLAYSPATTDDTVRSISVQSSTLSLNGPEYVTNKQLKTYTASTSSNWYERYDPESLPTWYFTLDTATVYTRIWPAGDYTRGLRAQKISGSPLGRGRIDVVVCHESIPGCGGPPPMEFVASVELSAPTATLSADWGLFGLGPWIHTGDGATRFYDLTGLHDPESPFADARWIEEPSGSASDAAGNFTIDWLHRGDSGPDIRAIELSVSPARSSPYRFGMAIDPDLGGSPADDRSGYDAGRSMAYAWDRSGAVGFLLLRHEDVALAGIDQYGTRRFAPRSASDAREAGRYDGVRLTEGDDDVQFVLSAGETTGPSTWQLVIVRAATVRELRARVDAYLGG